MKISLATLSLRCFEVIIALAIASANKKEQKELMCITVNKEIANCRTKCYHFRNGFLAIEAVLQSMCKK